MINDPSSPNSGSAGGDTAAAGPAPPRPPYSREFFGHPRGLATLFFTEIWERLSYYGMRGLLVLFMVTAAAEGGLGFSEGKAGAIYGLYVSGVYLLALPGGWLADRLLGQQRAVFMGGVVIALGHFSLAIPSLPAFYLGLALIVLGTGLLKPNVAALVGELYPEGGARRDAGFSIFYMGVNLGAFVGPLICGYLGEDIDWHLGFGAAGIGMVAGLIQYAYGRRYLGGAGLLEAPSELPPEQAARAARERRRIYLALAIAFGAIGAFTALAVTGVIPVTIQQVASAAVVLIVSTAFLFFGYVLLLGGLDRGEKKRVGALGLLFFFSVLFWMGFEQAGASMSLFALDFTDRAVGSWEIPASWFQSVNPVFIILLAPLFGGLWVALGKRNRNPTIPIKFGFGLVLLGSGFFALVFGARMGEQGVLVSPLWLVGAYFLHTCGELCLSPVGLSTATKLAPSAFKSQMVGAWYLSLSLGNLSAGLVSGKVETMPMDEIFFWVFAVTVTGGVLLWLFSPVVNRLTGGIR